MKSLNSEDRIKYANARVKSECLLRALKLRLSRMPHPDDATCSDIVRVFELENDLIDAAKMFDEDIVSNVYRIDPADVGR